MIKDIDLIGIEGLKKELEVCLSLDYLLAVISIRSTNKNATQFPSWIERENICHSAFDDVVEGDTALDIDTAKQIAAFIRKIDNKVGGYSLLVQSESGFSRAAAVALFAASISKDAGYVPATVIHANPYVLQRLNHCDGPNQYGWRNLLEENEIIEEPSEQEAEDDLLAQDTVDLLLQPDYWEKFEERSDESKDLHVSRNEYLSAIQNLRDNLFYFFCYDYYPELASNFISYMEQNGVEGSRYFNPGSLVAFYSENEKHKEILVNLESDLLDGIDTESMSFIVNQVEKDFKNFILPSLELLYEYITTRTLLYYRTFKRRTDLDFRVATTEPIQRQNKQIEYELDQLGLKVGYKSILSDDTYFERRVIQSFEKEEEKYVNRIPPFDGQQLALPQLPEFLLKEYISTIVAYHNFASNHFPEEVI